MAMNRGHSRARRGLGAVVFGALLLSGCSRDIDPNEPQGFVQVKGSDTLVNAVQEVTEEFMKRYPYVFVAVTGGGSGVGIASLINETCDVATASREMKPKEIEIAQKHGVFPKEFTVAYDGVAVIVNQANPVEQLTIEDLHRIFTGKATQLDGVRGQGHGHCDPLQGGQLWDPPLLQGRGREPRQEGPA